jgi:DNA-directed RNA polymerase specialized sigma24 family protein
MARSAKDTAIRQIQTLYQAGAIGGFSDRELLEQFVCGSEREAAFEVLVERHGPIVRATCRSLFGDIHEADDAFQATFLVLARRAGSIRNKEAVASWLYAVAARIALRTRVESRRRRALAQYLTEQARRQEISRHEPGSGELAELFDSGCARTLE